MRFFNYKGTMQKKKKLLFFASFILFISTMLLFKPTLFASASDDNTEEALSSSVSDIVSSIDFSGLQEILDDLENNDMFGVSITEKINKILSGNYFTDYSTILSEIFSIVFSGIKDFVPLIFSILAIGVLSTLLSSFRVKDSDASDMVYFVCFSLVVILILICFKDVLASASSIIKGISKLMQVVFPILIALLVSIGSMSSISIFNPLVAVLTTTVDIIFDKLLYPIFILIFLFTVLGGLTTSIKLDKLTNFFSSSFKWVCGIVFTLFTGFLSLQGISAGKFDSISIKATKFAVKSYIPIIGSFVADGMDFIVLGSVLVKNTVGLVAVFVLFIMIISPLIKLVLCKLLLQLTSGILELSGANKMSGFISNISKCLILPIVIIVGVAFMFIITVALIMCTANIF